MKYYLNLVQRILEKNDYKQNRTGIPTYSISGAIFEHDMENGFPLLTTKKMPFELISSELEFFIKGLTDKKWLQDRKNHIWDEWCNPEKVLYNHDEETKKKMMEERDLGPIYGFQWRHFGAKYKGYNTCYNGKGIDQLENVIKQLDENPDSRRIVVSAWNPKDLEKMALPPCHYQFQVTVSNNKLNLMWSQRSVDTMLGLPFNIASYGLLLHLLAKESCLEEGKLTGFLGDVHIYENHIDGVNKQLKREPYTSPLIVTENFSSIFDWTYKNSNVFNYKHHPKIRFDVAI